MAKAKKLPSGNWRVQVFSHSDADGKKHKLSFTAPTKKEAELKAAAFMADNNRRKISDITIHEAIDGYITAKKPVLSPSTIRNYRQMQRTRYTTIGKKRLKQISSEDLQLYVSSLSETVGPKTVSNVYGLLISAIRMYHPDGSFNVTLPKKKKYRKVSPSDDNVSTLFEMANTNMKKAIALSAFGSLRRGEICALEYSDLSGNFLHVSKDMIQNEFNEWEIKDIPKTDDGIRDVYLPDEVIELLGTGEKSMRIVPILPSSITKQFSCLRDKLDISVRFHDLRHYFASIGAVLGIPDIYLASFGGWRNASPVMKEIYQNKMNTASDYYAKKMGDHFSSILRKSSHESSHEK